MIEIISESYWSFRWIKIKKASSKLRYSFTSGWFRYFEMRKVSSRAIAVYKIVLTGSWNAVSFRCNKLFRVFWLFNFEYQSRCGISVANHTVLPGFCWWVLSAICITCLFRDAGPSTFLFKWITVFITKDTPWIKLAPAITRKIFFVHFGKGLVACLLKRKTKRQTCRKIIGNKKARISCT